MFREAVYEFADKLVELNHEDGEGFASVFRKLRYARIELESWMERNSPGEERDGKKWGSRSEVCKNRDGSFANGVGVAG